MCQSHSHSTCGLSVAASVLQEQSWRVVTIWPTNRKTLTTWLLTQNLCRPCWRLSSHSTYSRSNHFHHSYDPQVCSCSPSLSRTLRSTQQMANWEFHVDGTRDAKANGPTTELVSSALKLDLLPVIPSSEKTTTVYSVAQTRNLGIIDSLFSLPHPPVSTRNCRFISLVPLNSIL